jgi:uncharacterized protein YegL
MTSHQFTDDSSTRRLPVYLLLDVSGSMSGAPLEAVKQGMNELVKNLNDVPQAVETCWLSVITFESQARQVVPLTELPKFISPPLQTGGGTAMGAAFELLNQAIDRDVKPNTAERKGDYQPIIFLLTDGAPTDEYRSSLDRVKQRKEKKSVTLIALGCGSQANMDLLKEVANIALRLEDTTPQGIKDFFKWVTNSLGAASKGASVGGGDLQLPPPPATLTIHI